ncbi:hypothetical protein N7444_012926, partial [Penicillium canescens]
ESPSCRPTLQPLQPTHLNALNTTILHLNILHFLPVGICPPWIQMTVGKKKKKGRLGESN